VKRSGVRPSVRFVIRSSHAAAAGLLPSALPVGDIEYRSSAAVTMSSAAAAPQHGAQQQMRTVSRLQLT